MMEFSRSSNTHLHFFDDFDLSVMRAPKGVFPRWCFRSENFHGRFALFADRPDGQDNMHDTQEGLFEQNAMESTWLLLVGGPRIAFYDQLDSAEKVSG